MVAVYQRERTALAVHLDTAGVDIATADKGWVSKGASGYSVRALINLALAEAG
jgi:leucyl aminopeptidase